MDGGIRTQSGDALILVDVQKDFLPGGSLAVPSGEQVVPVLNRYIGLFRERNLPIFATRDWHPANHCSFITQGGPWPPHCVQGSPGAEFASDLALPEEAFIISSATNPDREAYSGFSETDLHTRLKALGIERLFIGGLATDYCVLNTVKDALALGYQVFLLRDAIRAVNVHPRDGEEAEQEMVSLGAVPVTIVQIA
jgi:nicotinamidase/pyrazinamidase